MLEKELVGVYNACSPLHPYKKDFYRRLAKRFQMPLPEFKEEDGKEGKIIDVGKLENEGYIFSFSDPASYTYDQDLTKS